MRGGGAYNSKQRKKCVRWIFVCVGITVVRGIERESSSIRHDGRSVATNRSAQKHGIARGKKANRVRYIRKFSIPILYVPARVCGSGMEIVAAHKRRGGVFLVGGIAHPPPRSVKTRRAPRRHFRDARVYGIATTAMHDMSTLIYPV